MNDNYNSFDDRCFTCGKTSCTCCVFRIARDWIRGGPDLNDQLHSAKLEITSHDSKKCDDRCATFVCGIFIRAAQVSGVPLDFLDWLAFGNPVLKEYIDKQPLFFHNLIPLGGHNPAFLRWLFERNLVNKADEKVQTLLIKVLEHGCASRFGRTEGKNQEDKWLQVVSFCLDECDVNVNSEMNWLQHGSLFALIVSGAHRYYRDFGAETTTELKVVDMFLEKKVYIHATMRDDRHEFLPFSCLTHALLWHRPHIALRLIKAGALVSSIVPGTKWSVIEVALYAAMKRVEMSALGVLLSDPIVQAMCCHFSRARFVRKLDSLFDDVWQRWHEESVMLVEKTAKRLQMETFMLGCVRKSWCK